MAKKKQTKKQAKKQTKKVEESPRFNYGNIVRWLWVLIICGMLVSAAVFVLIAYTKMPDTEELENPDLAASTKIYSYENREIGRLYSKNRDIIQFKDLNPNLVQALIATEDERFFDHSGIDARSILRAVVNLSRKGGGSTITQQLAKQFFTIRSRSFIKRVWQKLQEWVIAAQFEKRYTKEEIIAMYFNKYDFLNQSFGIGAAAKNYFGKDQSQLTIDEAAILVGMFKSPSRYNPKNNPERAMVRRNVVIKQMLRNEYIDEKAYKQYVERPIDMSNFKKPLDYDGAAPYFKSTLKKYLNRILEQDKYRKPDGTKYDMYKDGLKIYTTLNYDMQKHAEAAMKVHMKRIQDKYFDRWSNRDQWKYTTKDQDREAQLKFRKRFLTQVMKSTERYKGLRNKYMSGTFEKLSENYPNAKFREVDVERMLKEEAKPGYIKSLIRESMISSDQAKDYRNILKDELWTELKAGRKTMQSQAKKDFNKAIKMKVFTYNDQGEKTVTMTPLDSIKYHMEHMQIGSVSLDPKTGYIKTWVGGIDNKYFKIDHVLDDNQVGSTFKPFLYATAISHKAMAPCTPAMDIQHEIPAGEPPFNLLKTWRPNNADGKFSGKEITLKEGLRTSKNSISVWLVKQIGDVELIRELAENMGIKKSKIPKGPAIILGTAELNVLEMAGAYGTFANNGVYNEPTFVTKIENADGKVIYSSIPKQRRALSEKYNFAMVNLFANNLNAFNHLSLNPILKSKFGGKTGTTNDYQDGWFMGITPELVVGTWVGGENSWIRFRSLADGSGGAMARPYFFDFMKRLEKDNLINANAEFFVPDVEPVVMDCELYNGKRLPSKVEKDKEKKIKEFNDEFVDDEFEG
ncbi:MAG: penicillin-binding protein [Saprospiraceae bacterium]|nr:penicillin-binding protein [Bacteroidia bacterium]NNE16009.1 penicillin-binding protein [Saprospiraceae bacterium]NNL90709.1 penicillin-binding protein [Saprospiraceae bacterium]